MFFFIESLLEFLAWPCPFITDFSCDLAELTLHSQFKMPNQASLLEAARGRILPKKAELSELERVLSLSMLVKVQTLS